jgi:DNA polymerase bacteriophage-type
MTRRHKTSALLTSTLRRSFPKPTVTRNPQRRQGPHVLHHDVETRSRIDLPTVGAAKYAADPSTEIMCIAYAVDDEPVQLWIPGDPVPPEFIEAANNSNWTTVAHNDQFERLIARHILESRHGFPAIPIERRRCSMTMAYAAGLPGKLENVITALDLPYPKDKVGKALMQRMTKPQPDGTWIEDPASLTQLFQYSKRDVEAERAVYKAVPPLTADEQKLWELDAKINDRGFAIDVELLNAAHRVVTEAEAKLQTEFRELTGLSSDQVNKFTEWLAAKDCAVDNVQKKTLGHALRRKRLAPEARQAIELRLQLAHASTAKIEALLAWRGADNRVRGSLVFHGASTGRWVGRGPQPQNFKRSSAGIDAKIEAVMSGTKLESPLETVGDISRGLIVAAPKHRLLIGDFSGIESRVLAYVSGQRSKLDQWAKFDRTGNPKDEPYYLNGVACGRAADIAREKGKVDDLAFGYQGGIQAWKNHAPDDDPSTDDDIHHYQQSWRARHPHTVAFWRGIDANAIAAVRRPGIRLSYKKLRLVYDDKFLRITLPSDRALSYPFPRIEAGNYGEPCVVFKDASKGWSDCRFGQGAYGGLWTENIVSGVARDLLAAAMQRLEAAGYRIVLHVHDELVAEAPIGFGSIDEFRRILTAAPDWVIGDLPIAAKVRESKRFSKSEAATPANGDDHDGGGDKPGGKPAKGNQRSKSPAAAQSERSTPIKKSDPKSPGQPKSGRSRRREPELQLAPASAALQLPPPASPTTPDLDVTPEPEPEPADHPQRWNGNGHDREAKMDSYAGGNERDSSHSTDPELGPYIYKDARGNRHARVVRTPNSLSRFTQQHWTGATWQSKGPDRKLPYRLPELLAADRAEWVCITEGEKDAVNLAKLGFVATTNPNGANGWHSAKLIPYFTSLRRIAILEDNDAAGRERTKRIIKTLRLLDPIPDIRVVSFPELPDGGDVSDWLAQDRSRGYAELLARIEAVPAEGIITAEPYQVLAEDQITPWDWIYGRHLLRGEVSGSAAMGGTGKSSDSIIEALAMASGKPLLGEEVPRPLRVVLVNLEDTRNTMDKRISAAIRYYGLTQADIGDRLIVKAKGELKIKVARQLRSGDVERDEAIIGALTRLMIEHQADVLSIDSFIRTHRVNENDNSAIEEVVECFENVATEARCAVHLWHHTRKSGGEKTTIESARGAIAFIDAVRSARVLETMTAKEHDELKKVQTGLAPAGFYFRSFNGKRNFAPPADQSTWYKLESITLGNGDNVGVVAPWQYPATWSDLPPELIDRILQEIGTELPNGQRYSDAKSAKPPRAAWCVVQKHCPKKPESQCREIVRTWVNNRKLVSDEYDDPVQRKKLTGLFYRKEEVAP